MKKSEKLMGEKECKKLKHSFVLLSALHFQNAFGRMQEYYELLLSQQ